MVNTTITTEDAMTAPHDDMDMADLAEMYRAAFEEVEDPIHPSFVTAMTEAAEGDPKTIKAMWDAWSEHMNVRVDYLAALATLKAQERLALDCLETEVDLDEEIREFGAGQSWTAAHLLVEMLVDSGIIDIKELALVEVPEDFADLDDEDDGHLR